VNPQDQLRTLPSVEEVASALAGVEGRFPRSLIVNETRRVIEAFRQSIRSGTPSTESIVESVRRSLEQLEQPSLRRVINATGVVLHTNLGRAPLPEGQLPGLYSNLEYDLAAGKRGRRDAHFAPLVERLLGRPGIAVNNGAAAIWLALRTLAEGYEVIVSRGELIEIGDGFRIPDIMAESGAKLVEVGTTNRTRIDDYRAAISERTRLILRVHPSNFRIEGFTGAPSLEELSALGRAHGVPVYEDLGSGSLWDLSELGLSEPAVGASFRAGLDLVSFSGDKLLGGPQAGILAGRANLVERLRRHPMYRALRLDKLAVASLETTLRNLLLERWDRLPSARMIRQPATEIRLRAERLIAAIGGRFAAELIPGESVIGGGSTPEQRLPTWLIAIDDGLAMERKLRAATPPVIARMEKERLLLDLRTVGPEEEPDLVKVLLAC
jgi:L-seryl-tRNA(Ser) seleniumtransferase